MATPFVTEVVVYNIESALNARQGGADRVELCDNPGGGGTTPSCGTISTLRDLLDMDLFVMIRPREGDFCYSEPEYAAMLRDIDRCRSIGADGVVFGILSPDGTIDRPRCRRLIEHARPLQVTCHRAFDMTRNPLQALEECVAVGFDRILTSGQKATALEGLPLITKLARAAGNRIAIMPGCGIDEQTVAAIVDEACISQIHISAEQQRPSRMEFRNEAIRGMGWAKGGEYSIGTVSVGRVAAIRRKGLEAFGKRRKPGG